MKKNILILYCGLVVLIVLCYPVLESYIFQEQMHKSAWLMYERLIANGMDSSQAGRIHSGIVSTANSLFYSSFRFYMFSSYLIAPIIMLLIGQIYDLKKEIKILKERIDKQDA